MPGSKRPPKDLWQKLRPRAQQMRHEPTAAEELLWQRLRARQFGGLKFRRQHAIDRFVVDFYCAERRLVIEVDGTVHAESADQDAARDARLRDLGLQVLRFSNDVVLHGLTAVLERIAECAPMVPTEAPLLHHVERGPGGEVAGAAGRRLERR